MLTKCGAPIGEAQRRRWARAQEQEQEFWQQRGNMVWLVDTFMPRYVQAFAALAAQLPEAPVVVDVGSGPTCWGQLVPGEHIYLDPLMCGYVEKWDGKPPPGWLVAAMGEALPLRTGSTDLVVSVNAIDHCADPGLVVRECARIVKPGGLVAIGVYAHPPLRAALRRLWESLHINLDDAHAYSFTRDTVSSLMAQAGLEVLDVLNLGVVSARTRLRCLQRTESLAIGRVPPAG